MSGKRIDWDYINQVANMFVNEELITPRYSIPRLTFAEPLNPHRVFLVPGDELTDGCEGLIEEIHGYYVVLNVDLGLIFFVAGEERANLIDLRIQSLRKEEPVIIDTVVARHGDGHWPVPSLN